MNFWDFFRKKDKGKEHAATDSSAGFVPMMTTSDTDAGSATSTDNGASFMGGDGGGASGGDGGGGAS